MKSLAPTSTPTALDQIKGHAATTLEQEKARLRKATQEFEAFFRYQMMKAMRKTIPDDPLSQGLPMSSSQGKETFLDMMDMEISRAGSGGSGSIADILYRSTEKLLEAKYAKVDHSSKDPVSLLPTRTVRHISLQSKPIALPETTTATDLKPAPAVAPLPPRSKPAAVPLPAPTSSIETPQTNSPHDRIMERFGPLIEAAAAETQLDSTLITSVIHAESRGNPAAVSGAGAKGLMQLMDATAEDLGVTDSLDPEQNIMAGTRFLKRLVDKYQDLKLALAAYNAGPGNVDKYGGLPPFKETQQYVSKVMSMVEQFPKGAKVP